MCGAFAVLGAGGSAWAQLSLVGTFDGDSGSNRVGESLAVFGDIDGDAVADYAAGAPGFDVNRGRVYVPSGVTGAVIRTVEGDEKFLSDYGADVTGLGDVDGDDVPDFAVGTPNVNNSTGKVIVYSGATGAVLRTFDGEGM
ncbi:MAG: hypothetical protein KC466_02665, partial [Myxococcales bacterium]|nr:hypothetical protein [Myxococcales bacterium]